MMMEVRLPSWFATFLCIDHSLDNPTPPIGIFRMQLVSRLATSLSKFFKNEFDKNNDYTKICGVYKG
jgi:hypothetical protein